jgi:hypothetical protein
MLRHCRNPNGKDNADGIGGLGKKSRTLEISNALPA